MPTLTVLCSLSAGKAERGDACGDHYYYDGSLDVYNEYEYTLLK